VLYVCGAPQMVDSIKAIAVRSGATCYADPFVPTNNDAVDESVLTRVMKWLAVPTPALQERIAIESRQQRTLALPPPSPPKRRQQPMPAYRKPEAEPRVRRYYGPQSA
jgi:hypothetical protein